MKIVFAADHAGLTLKNELVTFVRDELGYDIEDLGADTLDSDDDYPIFISKAAERVSRDPGSVKGIILGGSGQGEAMLANRYSGVRAAVFYGGSHDIIRLSREHNDANILSLGARFIEPDEAKRMVQLWLETAPSTKVRYTRRIHMMEDMGKRSGEK